MKHFKKLLCLFLAVLMLLSVLVACKKDQPKEEETTAPLTTPSSDVVSADVEETTEEVWETDDKGFVLDKIKDVDLGGKKIRILTGTGRMPSNYVANDDINTPIKSAVFSRNQSVQVRLNCQLDFIEEQDGWEDAASYTQKAISMSTTQEVDMFAAYSMIPASLMMNGVLVDLLSNDILHFDAPWWNEKMVDSCTLYDKMYFCTGDISYELLGQLFAMQFNKDMAASVGLSEYLTQTYGVETLYDLVESGDWTIDTMMTIAKQFYEDKDGTKTQDDRFGFVTTVVALDAFWAGSNLRYLEQGNDGSIIVSDDMGSTKASDLAAKFVEFMKHPSVSVYSSFAQAINGNGNGVWEFHLWKGNQSLMYLGNLSYVLEEVPFDKGVLPVPKHDQDQEDYLTCSGFPFAMWGIARSATNYDDLCYVLECLASESYRKITPAYFDQALQGRQDTQKDYNMLELIRQSAFIDGGRVMTKAFNEWTYYVFRGALAGPSEYLPYYAEHEEALKEQALALNSLILNMEQLYG